MPGCDSGVVRLAMVFSLLAASCRCRTENPLVSAVQNSGSASVSISHTCSSSVPKRTDAINAGGSVLDDHKPLKRVTFVTGSQAVSRIVACAGLMAACILPLLVSRAKGEF